MGGQSPAPTDTDDDDNDKASPHRMEANDRVPETNAVSDTSQAKQHLEVWDT